jgi:hypothetical protein
VDRERIGRLLMTLAAVVALGGVPFANDSVQAGRVLGVSGCLVMVALGLLLLAPRPATRAERRARAQRIAREARQAALAEAQQYQQYDTYRVPRQRAAVPAGSQAAEESESHAA